MIGLFFFPRVVTKVKATFDLQATLGVCRCHDLTRTYSFKGVFPQVHRPQDIVVTGALRAVSHVRCRGKGPKLAWEHTEQPAQASGRTTGREPGMCVG